MSKMLWNPTNDELSYQFSGITYFFNPGARKKVDDACGKHLLHNLGVRGLTVLDYGCDEDALKKDALDRNREFKKKMVVDFNQRNENRKQQGMAYFPPTRDIKAYALELGLGLVEPYNVRDDERAAYASLKEENDLLKDRLGKMEGMISKLVEAQSSGSPEPRGQVKQKGA